MKKRSSKEILKSCSNIYIILSIIILVFAVIINFVPAVRNEVMNLVSSNDEMLEFNIQLIVNIFIYLWYFWLARRVVNGKSNGTFYMVLLILGVVSSLSSAIILKSTAALKSIDFIIDLVVLYFLLKFRKENK